jgi:hypothetical protein
MNDRFKNTLHVPRMKPYSNDTWEVQGPLDGDQEVSQVVPLVFPAACRIVGLYPSITLNDTGSLLVPNLDDVMVLMDMNQQRRYTNQIGQTSQAQKGQGFVTVNALNTLFRDLNIEVDNGRPQAGFQFRWKRFIPGTPLYRDVIISLALFVEIDD